jgi:hypothetical protein
MPAVLLPIQLLQPVAPKSDQIGDASWILRACVRFPDLIVLGLGAPGVKKAGLDVFPELRPISGSRFEVEFAAVLHERLPGPAETPEYSVTVAQSAATSSAFCVSNVMQILRFRQGDTDHHALCPAAFVDDFTAEHASEFGSPHREFAPSVVTARYEMTGDTAEAALSESIEACVDDFIDGINRIVSAAIVSIDPERIGILTAAYDRGSFPCVYMLMRGAEDRFDAHRLATSLLRTTLVPSPYKDDEWTKFNALVRGDESIDVSLKSLRTAESYIQAGAYEFAFLLTAIGVEVATSRYVHDRLRSVGVSKKQLANVKKDLTFSIMLNTQIAALAPPGKKPDPDLIAEVDLIRKRRNDLMHYGTFGFGKGTVHGMLKSAIRFVRYLESLEP